jgi:hypothetical protein
MYSGIGGESAGAGLYGRLLQLSLPRRTADGVIPVDLKDFSFVEATSRIMTILMNNADYLKIDPNSMIPLDYENVSYYIVENELVTRIRELIATESAREK